MSGPPVTTPEWREPIALLPAALPPLRKHIEAYLDYKTKRITPATEKGYRSVLRAFETYYSALELSAFEPPAGTLLIEDFLTAKWARRSGRTYNKALSILRGLFEWLVKRGLLQADPTEPIEEAREETYQRSTFTDEECDRIFAANPGEREQIALTLLLFYGIRKGALRGIRLRDFDAENERLTIFTKGQKYQVVPVPAADPIWSLLERLDEPDHHYLIPRQQQRRRTPTNRRETIGVAWLVEQAAELAVSVTDPACVRDLEDLDTALLAASRAITRAHDSAAIQVKRFYDEPISDHALHDLWYRWLERAGVVAKGATSGRRMHDSRHTAAQRVLDRTGNVRMVQELLGHANAAVTENYLGPSEDRLRKTLAEVLTGQLAKPAVGAR